MEADIRKIRLVRKAVVDKQDSNSLWENGQCFFATDYFDIVHVEKMKIEDSLAEIMDIGVNNTAESYGDEAAIQSYALYCSPEMLDKYETQNDKYRKDPFAQSSEMKYLSIIHVYIVPEIMARMSYSVDDLWESENKIILEPFLDDIYHAMDLFYSRQREFTARVYLMLSAGNFAVVVRSKNPGTSYHISTCIRKRVAGKNQVKGVISSGYVLYKTYTLLALDPHVAYEPDAGNNATNYFIVRGSYSNKYWKEQQSVQAFKEEMEAELNEFYSINGRYDFTARLTEREFSELLREMIGHNESEDEKRSGIVTYISYLLQNKYLSYLNERYLISKQENLNKDEESISTSILLDIESAASKDLYERNMEKLDEIQTIMERASKSVLCIKGYRKQIGKYLFFLKKQVSLCQNINELSDTRIYAGVLAEQLEVAWNSIETYAKLCENGNGVLLNDLEDYLRKTVRTLDRFAQYIRNNNLQSLQTPNYNIETSTGMEKILIGYSELLWKFMDYYQRAMHVKPTKKYLPVMVPDLHDREVNVEVLFPEKNMGHGTVKAHNSLEALHNRYMMVVESASLEEISDIPIIITALFHEVAHQLRYEPRNTRNDVLLKPAIREAMRNVAEQIAESVNNEIGYVADESGSLVRGLAEGLTEAVIKSKYARGRKYFYEFQNGSMEYFKSMLAKDINELFSEWTRESKLKMRVKEFIAEVRYGVVMEELVCQEEIGILEKLLDNGSIDSLEKIIIWAFRMAWLCAYRCLRKSEKRGRKERWTEEAENRQIFWETEWDRNFGGVDNKNVKRIKKTFFLFWNWMDWYIYEVQENDLTADRTGQEKRREVELFEDELYRYMKKYWDKELEQSMKLHDTEDSKLDEKECINAIPPYRYWTVIGRHLGLDYDTKEKKRFRNIMKKETRKSVEKANLTVLMLYREETADLLMCNVMQLTELGYLSMAALLFTQDEYHSILDTRRIFCVIYVHWCYVPDDPEKSWRKYMETCCTIFKHTKKYAAKANRVIEELLGRNVAKFEEELRWKDISDEVRLDCERQIEEEMKRLNTWSQVLMDAGHDEADSALKQIKNAMRIYDLLIEMIQNGRYCWSTLNDNAELLADLAKGDAKLKKLVYKKMVKCEDKSIVALVQAGKSISQFLSQSYSQKGLVRDKVANQQHLEFLLKMYYNNNIRIAQNYRFEGGDNENKYDDSNGA